MTDLNPTSYLVVWLLGVLHFSKMQGLPRENLFFALLFLSRILSRCRDGILLAPIQSHRQQEGRTK